MALFPSLVNVLTSMSYDHEGLMSSTARCGNLGCHIVVSAEAPRCAPVEGWRGSCQSFCGEAPPLKIQYSDHVMSSSVQLGVTKEHLKVERAAAEADLCIRGRHGGVEKRGGWKTSRMTPPPKRGFGPPPYGTFSTPLRCQCSVFPVQNSTTEQTRSSFGGVQQFSGELVLWCIFLPPMRFAPPPYHGPSALGFSLKLGGRR